MSVIGGQLIKLIVLVAVVVAVMLGQGRMESALPGRFEASLAGDVHYSRMDVILTDTTGLVLEMKAGGDVRGGNPVAAVSGRSDLIVVKWLSGGCDDYARLALRPLGDRYELSVTQSSTPIDWGCSYNFLLGFQRSVTLRLSTPVSPESIEFRQA